MRSGPGIIQELVVCLEDVCPQTAALAILGERYLKRPRHLLSVKAKRPCNRAYGPHNNVPPTLDLHATLDAVGITAATSTDENTAPAFQPGRTDASEDFDHINRNAIE